MSRVKVVIPLYRESLPDLEVKLLRHNLDILSSYEVVLLMPEGLRIDIMRLQFNVDAYPIVRVSPEWLGRKNGVAGYNRMMMSSDFYALFSDVDYILICQSDVYLFRDELNYWVSRGYDYIGAPWIKKTKYDTALARWYLRLRTHLHRKRKGFMRQDLFGKVGNGGLSLRHVAHFHRACDLYKDKINEMCALDHNLSNEDIFWALVPEDFHYPDIEEAMRFSVDTNPALCLELLRGELPFGCHGLTHESIYEFWWDKIDL